MYDYNYIENKVNELRAQMNLNFPDKHNTVMMNLWDDGDFSIECRCGIGDVIYLIKYHHSMGTTYETSEMFKSAAVKMDELGNRFYIPDELIPHIN